MGSELDTMDTGAIPKCRQESKWSGRFKKLPEVFELGELLGEGQYGEVIKARSKHDDIDYAIKIVKIGAEELEICRREVKNVAALHHPNVVRYHTSWTENVDIPKDEYDAMTPDSSQSSEQTSDNSTSTSEEGDHEHNCSPPNTQQSSDSVIFAYEESDNGRCSPPKEDIINMNFLIIQMELCSHDLRREIDMDLYKDETKSWRYFREICEGLVHIHRNNIIHRDLKPENIFISDSGSIKIGDFNLSRRIPQNFENAGGSQEFLLSENCGTKLYMAPEMINNDYDEKVDMNYIFRNVFKKKTDAEKWGIFPLHRTPNWYEVMISLKSPQKVDLLWKLLEPNAKIRLSSEVLMEMLKKKVTTEQIKNTIKSSTASNSQMNAYDSILKSSNNDLEQTRDFIRTAVEVFEIHNGENISMPLLQPKRRSNGNNMCLMTEHGQVVSLSNNSRVALCEYLRTHAITNKRRYSVGKLFEDNSARHPKEVQECVFDVISPNEHDFMIEAEVLYIIKTIIRRVFPRDAIKAVEFYINHALIFREIMSKYLRKASMSNLLRMSSKQWITLLQARDSRRIEEHCSILNVSRSQLEKLKEFARPIAINNASGFLENQQEFNERKLGIAIRNVLAIAKSFNDFNIDNVYLIPLLITDKTPNKIMCQVVVKTRANDSIVIASVDRFDHLLKRYSRGYEFSAVGLSFHVAEVVEIMQEFPLLSNNNDDLYVVIVQHDKADGIVVANNLWSQKIRCEVITEGDFNNGYLDQYKGRFNVRLLKLARSVRNSPSECVGQRPDHSCPECNTTILKSFCLSSLLTAS